MLIIVGPSASGKTQIVFELTKKYGLKKMVTYTTRPKRINEIDGIDYHFISKDLFLDKIKNNFFLEYVCYSNNYYGTAIADIKSDSVVILEPNGLSEYLKKVRDKVKVVFLTCDEKTLEKRMKERGDNELDIKERLKKDKIIFNKDVAALSDLVLDTSNTTLDDETKKIYQFYYPFILENEL